VSDRPRPGNVVPLRPRSAARGGDDCPSATQPAEGERRAFDARVVKRLAADYGSHPQFLPDLATAFTRDCESALDRIRAANAAGDPPTLYAALSALQRSAINVGATALADACSAALVSPVASPDVGHLESLAAAARSQLGRVVADLRGDCGPRP
jgi:HPt (histidine-containing phosphotransfer) domain-containing protein